MDNVDNVDNVDNSKSRIKSDNVVSNTTCNSQSDYMSVIM